jgi:NADH-quinone oxidoreductase subunit L
MFVGLGVGAYAAGIFHLMTHAFFKSLLFLSAGSVIHAMSGEQDMRKMGGLRKHIPRTFTVFFIGALAIAGIPGLSGFFSKDEILASAYASGNYVVWALGLLGAGMTAFYMFRLIFMTFYGDERIEHEAKHHLHESPNVMVRPLQVLALLSIIGGYVGLPHILGGGNWFGKFLGHTVGHHELELSAGIEILLMAVSVGIGLIGIYSAYIIYVKHKGKPAESVAVKLKFLYKLVYNKYFIDEFYNRVFVGGSMKLGTLLGKFDLGIIDGIVNGVAYLIRKISSASILVDSNVVDGAVNGVGALNNKFSNILKRFQSGYVYNYALSIVIGIVILISLTVIVYS